MIWAYQPVLSLRIARKIGLLRQPDHTVTVYGEPSPQLVEMARRMPQGSVKWYSFPRGLYS
jgi:hypothetical protein